MVLVLADLHRAAAILEVSVSIYSCALSPSAIFIQAVSSLTTYLRNQHLIALLNAHRYPLAFAIETTGTDSQDLGLVQLLDGGLGQEDAAGGLGLSLNALDQDAVEEGCE
jgi:hypothetical protein